jgi:hypothetical protein
MMDMNYKRFYNINSTEWNMFKSNKKFINVDKIDEAYDRFILNNDKEWWIEGYESSSLNRINFMKKKLFDIKN